MDWHLKNVQICLNIFFYESLWFSPEDVTFIMIWKLESKNNIFLFIFFKKY